MTTPYPGDTAAEVGQLILGTAEQETAERKTGEAGQESGEREAPRRGGDQTLRSSKGG